MSSNRSVNGVPLPPKDKDIQTPSVPSTDGNGGKNIMPENTMTNTQKWVAAIFLGLLFAIISSPAMYSITSLIAKEGTLYKSAGGATMLGLLVHTIVFILIVRLIMW